MKTTGSEYFYRVKRLSVPSGVDAGEMNAAIEKYVLTERMICDQLKLLFSNGNWELLKRLLKLTHTMLERICAVQNIAACEAIMKALGTNQIELCRRSLPAFIASLHMLSDEITIQQSSYNPK